jgi:SAM-dependent methyltransferase
VHNAEFNDRRLVEVYDAECVWGPDDDFFRSVVAETPRARVLDLGCGTGRLTIALAQAGHRVTGVDPAQASLDAAAAKAARAGLGSDHITLIRGTAAALPTLVPAGAFDVAVLTSHVAQFLIADDEWADTLAALARALGAGGVLTFDSRDPVARGWEAWNPVTSRRAVTLPDGETVTIHTEVTDVEEVGEGVAVSFTRHYAFGGEVRAREAATSTATLRFRSEHELRQSLADAGFAVTLIFGGWHREPVGAGDGELLVVASRSA